MSLTLLELTAAGDHTHRAEFADAEWLREIALVELGAGGPWKTGDVESLLLVLSGTHDLFAGGGSWLQRGLRPTCFDGRPVAVFLPPATEYRGENGTGQALCIGARQPELPKADDPKAELSKKPLLPMAGSGKAFDPNSGSWLPKEAFLGSSEAILPRRIERVAVGDVTVERVIDAGYKALALAVDEVVLAGGSSCRLPASDRRGYPLEQAVFCRSDARLRVRAGDDELHLADGQIAFCAGGEPLELTAVGGRAYAAIAYAGPKV